MSKDRFVKGFHCKCKIMYDCMPGRRARERELERERERERERESERVSHVC